MFLAGVLSRSRTSSVGAYAQMALADGPLFFLALDDPAGSTVAQDLSGNGRVGTYGGGASCGQPSMFSSGRASVRLPGTSITIPSDSGLLLPGDLTLEITCRMTGNYSLYGNFPKLITKFTNYVNGWANYALHGDKSTGFVRGRVSTPAQNYNDAINTYSSQDNVARTYTLRRVGNLLALFVEGVKVAEITVSGANQTSTDAIVIGGSGSTDAIDAYFQWACLYGYALSDSRIAQRIAAR